MSDEKRKILAVWTYSSFGGCLNVLNMWGSADCNIGNAQYNSNQNDVTSSNTRNQRCCTIELLCSIITSRAKGRLCPRAVWDNALPTYPFHIFTTCGSSSLQPFASVQDVAVKRTVHGDVGRNVCRLRIKTESIPFHSAMRADKGWGSHHDGHALEIKKNHTIVYPC